VAVMKSSVFWDITPVPSAFTLVSCLTYSTLKIEAICSSETLVDFQQTAQRYNPEDSTLHTLPCSVS
jgi:hypothetical protein